MTKYVVTKINFRKYSQKPIICIKDGMAKIGPENFEYLILNNQIYLSCLPILI